MKRGPYISLLILTIIAAVGGLLTLLPWAGASYPNIMGYKSLCTFAPAATFFCFLIAGTSCFIRSTFFKDENPVDRVKRHAHAFAPLGLVLVIALVCTFLFFNVKARYTGPDAVTAVTESME